MRYSPPTKPTRRSPRGRWKSSMTSSSPRAGKAMSRAPDANGERGDGGLGPVRILVADADCALYGLLEEWFAASGWQLAGACQPDETALEGYDLILVDVPFPR